MWVWPLVFIIILGSWISAHVFVYIRFSSWLNLSHQYKTFFLTSLIILSVLYPVIRITGNFFRSVAIDILENLSTLWIGVMFYLFFVTLLFYIISLFLLKTNINPTIISLSSFWGTIIITFFIILYGYYSANQLTVQQKEIMLNNLPKKCDGFKILQLTDLHLGNVVGKKWLEKVRKKVNKTDPDLIVITGDLVDEPIDSDISLIDEIKKMKTRYGIYGVTGNHEYYAGIESAKKFYTKAGIRLLTGESVEINNCLNVAGIPDEEEERFFKKRYKYEDIFSKINKQLPVIFLKHRPKDFDELSQYVDIMFSGHTHGGQLFPFHLAQFIAYRHYQGIEKINNKFFIVSRGTGTWGPRLRILAPNEIWVITLRSSKK